MLHLKEKYKKEVVSKMMEEFGYKNPMAVPKIEKVVVNCGFGRMVTTVDGSKNREKIQENILKNMSLITGQKPALREAKKSISSFKLRKGMPIGAMVTLRGQRMYDFLERLIWITLPRTRDFGGISKKTFDEKGNLTIGFKEYIPFPEVKIEKEKGIFGLEVIVATTAKTREQGSKLLKLLGFPIQQK